MAWTPKQIRTAAIAARNAGWNDQQRMMVLSSFGGRAVSQGRLSSKSPRLNQDDYEQYMALAEAQAGGMLPGFTLGYWRAKAGDVIQRQRHVIQKLAADLDVPGQYIDGIIDRATGGQARSLFDIDQINDRAVAGKVIDALKYKRKSNRPPAHTALTAEAIPF